VGSAWARAPLRIAVGGPLALLVAALAGYAVAAAALRPVERMRRRAAELTAGEAEGRHRLDDTDAVQLSEGSGGMVESRA
jgi:hypothetical protein